ncbi:MAG: type I-U CRISPR-associated helicase/endonuclease Cas3 [Pirellula sp.]
MTTLSSDDFAEFFNALHGYRPFRWQQRLANQVATGDWPQALALPTASGKTACIDIALFALACQADWPNEKRTAPRRIFFVVDRRIIVDEAHTRAAKIATKLRHATSGVLGDISERLRSLAGGDDAKPLVCGELRGGIYRDNTWAKTPTQPTIICSTVDQIGSRLLFRGYGLGPGTRVVHAGLVANDAIVILDEAHCAKPFYQTAQAVRRYRDWCDPAHKLATPFHFVVMSATPPTEIPDNAVFPTRDDWESDLKQPDQKLLRSRVETSKPAKLVEATKETAKSNTKLVATLVEQAVAQVSDQHRHIGIIVNRVATAKQVYELLRTKKYDAILLTGRMRGIDRDELLKTWQPRFSNAIKSVPAIPSSRDVEDEIDDSSTLGLLKWFGVDSERPLLDHPVFVVATQCLEVGANLDFDALVTECASLDALRQRFGRLNRAGRETESDQPFQSRAVIVIRGDQVEPKEDDAVYGSSLSTTWKWLKEIASHDVVDFGIDKFENVLPLPGSERSELLATLQMPSADAPVMLPAHVDCWVQTAPVPMPDPDPAIFLHGPKQRTPEIQVCWRADLDASLDWASNWIDALSLCPPSTAECLSVPLYLARNWLRDQATKSETLSDVETVVKLQEDEDDEGISLNALIWRGPDDSKSKPLKSTKQLRPGDTLVLAVPIGRNTSRAEDDNEDVWDLFGHVPREAVIDRGDETNFATRNTAVLRLHPTLFGDWPDSDAKTELLELIKSDDPSDGADEFKRVLRNMLDAKQVPRRLQKVIEAIAFYPRRLKVYLHSSCDATNQEITSLPGVILVRPGRVLRDQSFNEMGELHETFVNDDDSSSASHEIELTEHLQGVAEFAQRFAAGSGLAEAFVRDFVLAAKCHDLGKLDQRFQAWLRGGNLLQARLAPKLLAKSEGQTSRSAREQARIRSGYPNGARHELLSVRLLEQARVVLDAASDPDLVLHLIASHHGHCRPFAPVIIDENPLNVKGEIEGQPVVASSATALERLDSGVAERFWRLVRRYGWWGLAWLEAIFILCDHRCSEDEQRKTEGSQKAARKQRAALRKQNAV